MIFMIVKILMINSRKAFFVVWLLIIIILKIMKIIFKKRQFSIMIFMIVKIVMINSQNAIL